MAKLYTYTTLNQDGTSSTQAGVPKKSLRALYGELGCRTIELIPRDYYANKGWGRCTVYGDEEARFDRTNHTNPHFNVLAPGYDIVGKCIKEEVYHG